MDPENLILTNTGKAYIQSRIAANQKCRIGSFRLGDTILFVPDVTQTNVAGIVTYNGVLSEMQHVQYTENEAIIRCILEPNIGDFLIGNAGLYSDTGVLLFIAKFVYQHHKMASTDTNAGGRWSYQVRLIMDDLYDHWDFSNIQDGYAKAPMHSLVNAPAYPYDSFYTEIQLTDCLLPTSRNGYFYMSGETSRTWFTSPFQRQMSDLEVKGFYDHDGGVENDKHKYFA